MGFKTKHPTMGKEGAAAYRRETRPDGRCTQGVAHLPSAGPRKGHWCGAEPLASGAAVPVWPMPPTEVGLAQAAPAPNG